MNVRPPEMLVLAKFGSDIEVAEVFPKDIPARIEPTLLSRSFPLSAVGGEVVIYREGDKWVSSLTVNLGGEKPRSGLASIIAVYPDRDSALAGVRLLLRIHEGMGGNLTLEDLRESLPKIVRYLTAVDESSGGGNPGDSRSKIVKKGYMFFFGGGE